MARRYKSRDDISAQENRINTELARRGVYGQMDFGKALNKARKITAIADRYRGNLWNGHRLSNEKASRSVYMGLSNG